MRWPYARVPVLLALLACGAVALPAAAQQKESSEGIIPTINGILAAMKSDLKNLASQEEIYYANHYSYTRSTVALTFTNSEGVDITIPTATTSGWAAYATAAALGSRLGCAIYYGRATTPTSAPATPTAPGEISCHHPAYAGATTGRLRLRPGSGPIIAPGAVNASSVQWQPVVRMGGELYPAFVLATATLKTSQPRVSNAGALFGDRLGMFGVRVTTPHPGARVRVKIIIPGIASASSEEVALPQRGVTYQLFPSMMYDYAALRGLREPTPANVQLQLYVNDTLVGTRTQVISVRSVNDIPFEWTPKGGQPLSLDWMFAAVVNENAPQVDSILHDALKSDAIDQFVGYQQGQQEVEKQVYAIWHVLHEHGFHYSNVTTTSNVSATVASQNVRSVGEAWGLSEANCADGSILFASILRRIGIDPFLVRLPDHMMVGFYLNQQHTAKEVLETTMLGSERYFFDKSRFNAAIGRGAQEFNAHRQQFGHVPGYLIIDIAAARREGILPIG